MKIDALKKEVWNAQWRACRVEKLIRVLMATCEPCEDGAGDGLLVDSETLIIYDGILGDELRALNAALVAVDKELEGGAHENA